LLHDSDASQWRGWLDDGGVSFRPESSDRRFEDYELVLVAACAGLGVALLRSPFADAWLSDGRLARVHARAMPNETAHYLVSSRESPPPPATSSLKV
jgi:LysR family glycine cleavage system transcriptional activator